MLAIRHLWKFRPRPFFKPWAWGLSIEYYRWRVETYTGIKSSKVTWRTMLALARERKNRKALWRYVGWLDRMHKLRVGRE